MAYPTPVNDQITDSVTQSNVQVLASSPAMALGSLYQGISNSQGLATQNASSNQQNISTISSSVTSACVDVLLSE